MTPSPQPISQPAVARSTERTWIDLHITSPADTRALVAIALAAVAADLALRSGVATVAGALSVAVSAGGLLASGRLLNPAASAVAAVAPLFGTALAFRTSPWLVPLDVIAAAGLLVLAASMARGGSPFDLTVPGVVARSAHALVHGLAAPAFVRSARRQLLARSPAAGGRAAAVGVVRGVLLAAPVIALLGLLLASADPVFASLFRLPTDAGDLVLHAVLLTVGAWAMAGLLRLASAEQVPALPPARRVVGVVEATTVLGSMAALYAAFVAAQVVTARGGARHVLRTAGLTYAEYARSGFFQLLAAAAVTLAVVLALRALALPGPADRWFLVLAEAAVVLTIAVVVVAVVRLRLYEQQYGPTMLRLYSTTFAVWIGAVFVLLGVSLAGVGHERAWLVPAAASAGLLLLAVLNVANPEAIVVDRSVAHARATGRFDAVYVTSLSDDAVPALVRALPALDADHGAEVRARLCGAPDDGRPGAGLWAANAGAGAADRARRALCGDLSAGSANVRSG